MDQVEAQSRRDDGNRFDARAGWIVALAALTLAAIGGMVSVSSKAGALDTRVNGIETRQNVSESNQSKMLDKIDSIADSVARIEGKLSK